MSSTNLMTTTVVKGGATTIDIDGVPIEIWVKFDCEFQLDPTSQQLRKNKRRMRRYLQGHLLGLLRGDLFSLFILWYRDNSHPSRYRYRVVVAIFETEPPPGNTTPIPTPPPGGPGGM